jgi:PPK2 family polyphosphate:nucleotide phosphotransferase
MQTSRMIVTPGSEVRLADLDPADRSLFEGDKADGEQELAELTRRLYDLQHRLYAEGRHRVLLVLQGMDTSGKDGTVRHVFRETGPIGVRVTNFGRPNTTELAHDYLWRVHQHSPADGEIKIFNRSHYEDVLVVRVHNLVPPQQWLRRYEHICAFEKMLTDEGATIIKVFLHISKDEQKARLEARLQDPRKTWKFEHGDVEERKRWDDYLEAYEAALTQTSTDYAPWYIVPSNRKWLRNLLVAQILVDTLEGLDMSFPDPPEGLENIVIE